jgi:hypothetical protein
MSALGQKQTLRGVIGVSALPPKADIGPVVEHDCFGPKTDIIEPPRDVRFAPESGHF